MPDNRAIRSAPLQASSRDSVGHAVLEFLGRLNTPCRVLVAYSGGGDSTGLLACLAEVVTAYPDCGVTLLAATVDHGLRSGSDAEARSVGMLCDRFSIPHHILTWQGEKPKTGIQAAAREARYRLLAELAKSVRADLIVTAHTADDDSETLLMRRARNPDAVDGISEAVLYGRQIWIWRPLLKVRRAAIRDFLQVRDIGWVEDPSNDNVVFERVRVRRTLEDDKSLQAALPMGQTDFVGADQTARFLLDHVSILPARLAVVDIAVYDAGNVDHLSAILYLAAMMGGRPHRSGRETTARIAAYLSLSATPRLTAERVVFDRRRRHLYIGREKRSMPTLTLAGGETAVWDGRVRITNRGVEPVAIGTSSTGVGVPILPGGIQADLPGSIRQRVEATEPRLLTGQIETISAHPVIAQFDRFLPLRLLPVANALAFLSALDHFPELPVR